MRPLLLIMLVLLVGCSAGRVIDNAVDPEHLQQIGGTILADLTLDGDYLLTADLQVPYGLTLTIKPGSRIFIQPSDSTKIDPEFLSRETEILVRGSLVALGTTEQPILFTPVADDQSAILWSGLQLVASEIVRLNNVVVEQAETGLLCLNSSPDVRSLIVQRSRYGIILQQKSAPTISDSLITHGEAGLFCWDQSSPQVRNSRFEDLQEEGLYLGRGCQGQFVDNRLSAVDRAVVLPANADFPISNQLTDNRINFVRYQLEGK